KICRSCLGKKQRGENAPPNQTSQAQTPNQNQTKILSRELRRKQSKRNKKLKVQALNHPEAGLATEIPFGKVIRDFFKILTSETYVYGVRFLSANGEIKQLETEIKELEIASTDFTKEIKISIPLLQEVQVLTKLAKLTVYSQENYQKYNFNLIYQALLHFCINDLSSFYLEISKDSLYCDSLESPRRKQIITVLYYLLAGLLKIIAPFLPFLAEEVYENIPFSFGYAEKESVLFLPDSQFLLTAGESNTELIEDFLLLRQDIFSALEKARQAKIIHTNSQAQVLVIPKEKAKTSQFTSLNLARLLLIAQIKFIEKKSQTDFYEEQNYTVKVAKTSAARCVLKFDEETVGTELKGDHPGPIYPFEVFVPNLADNGRNGKVMVDQIKSIDKERLLGRAVNRLNEEQLAKPNETPEEAAKREVFEETNLIIENLKIVAEKVFSGKNQSHTGYLVKANKYSGEIKIKELEKITDIKFKQIDYEFAINRLFFAIAF
ncbi:15622_t:CDS:2, partial [Entrophospora sp. SA101]